MVLVKSFLTEALYDCFKLIYVDLDKGDKICDYYSCLKLMIKVHYLNDSIKILKCHNQVQLFNKELTMKCLAIKIFARNFLQLRIQKV